MTDDGGGQPLCRLHTVHVPSAAHNRIAASRQVVDSCPLQGAGRPNRSGPDMAAYELLHTLWLRSVSSQPPTQVCRRSATCLRNVENRSAALQLAADRSTLQSSTAVKLC